MVEDQPLVGYEVEVSPYSEAGLQIIVEGCLARLRELAD